MRREAFKEWLGRPRADVVAVGTMAASASGQSSTETTCGIIALCEGSGLFFAFMMCWRRRHVRGQGSGRRGERRVAKKKGLA